MVSGERRPLLYQRESRFSKQPIPERVGTYRPECVASSSHVQTVVNSINVLVGVGLLSLPLAMRYAGWAPGLCLLTFSAAANAYAAKLLGHCMEADRSLKTYVDIAGASFGTRGQLATSILFSLNMIAACVALVILFGDTATLLVPSWSSDDWKLVCGLIVLPMQFVSFRVLAPVSIVGVASCIGIIGITIIAGLVHHTSPGSLHQPAQTSLAPESWFTLLVSIGLFMSPWGANASFPTFYRDMKNPRTYGRCLGESFTIAYSICIAMAACGYMMFGPNTAKAITSNILNLSPPGYPHALLATLVFLTTIMPVTKITLSSRPLINMIEDIILDTNQSQHDQDQDVTNTRPVDKASSSYLSLPQTPLAYNIYRVLIRFFVIALIVGIAVVVPGFDWVLSLMGSALCYTISVILPILFYMRLVGDDLSKVQKFLHGALVAVCGTLALLGTGAALVS